MRRRRDSCTARPRRLPCPRRTGHRRGRDRTRGVRAPPPAAGRRRRWSQVPTSDPCELSGRTERENRTTGDVGQHVALVEFLGHHRRPRHHCRLVLPVRRRRPPVERGLLAPRYAISPVSTSRDVRMRRSTGTVMREAGGGSRLGGGVGRGLQPTAHHGAARR